MEEQKFPRLRSYHLVFTWVFRLVEFNMLADYFPPLNEILARMGLKRGKNHPKDAKTPNIWPFLGISAFKDIRRVKINNDYVS